MNKKDIRKMFLNLRLLRFYCINCNGAELQKHILFFFELHIALTLILQARLYMRLKDLIITKGKLALTIK